MYENELEQNVRRDEICGESELIVRKCVTLKEV